MILDKKTEQCLPAEIIKRLRNYPVVNEIRIRENRPVCFIVGTKNYISDYVSTKQDLDFCVSNFCKNSVHAFTEYIKKGFIPFDNGYRIGVCGTAISENDAIKYVTEINSLNIRIPNSEINIPQEFLNEIPYNKGLLIYSAANVGKTAFLKKVIVMLSAPPYNQKVAVIDCRREIFDEKLHKDKPIDFFFGYPKYPAIEIALRTMSPNIIICDEIGLNDDISPLIECKNSGVSLICTAHASSLKEVIQRPSLASLVKANVFGGFVGIKLKNNQRYFNYTSREDLSDV